MSNVLTIKQAKLSDVKALAPYLRRADVREIIVRSGRPAYDNLMSSFNTASFCHSIYFQDTIIAMFGVTPTKKKRVGRVWMLANDELYNHSREIVRISKPWVNTMMKGHNILYNHVHADNKASIRWLKWIGFEMLELHNNFGVGKEDFWYFAKFRDNGER